ncbi:MAG: adenylate/guanylate cyclase domain-containing protein [Pseudomonadota bacterium]
MKRKIAAIFAADVVGYSRMIAEDEEDTLQCLASYRQVMDDFIVKASGRIFNTGGDSVFAEFSSSVEAVRAAIDIQEALRSRNLQRAPERQMNFRIGITVGDVVERDGDLLGDGVNIAARLEGLADPGGICVSRTVYEQVANKIAVQFADIGEQQVKNIPQPVHAYSIGPKTSGPRSAAALAPKPEFKGAPTPHRGAIFAGGIAAVVIAGIAYMLVDREKGIGPVEPAPLPTAQAAAAAPRAPRALVPDTIPFIADRYREAIRNDYLNAPEPKALAVGSLTIGFASAQPDLEIAKAAALQICQSRADEIKPPPRRCELYAVGNEVVSAVTAPPLPPAPWLVRNPAIETPFSVADIPLVSNTGKANLEKNYASQNKPKALALHSSGSYSYYHGQQSQDEAVRRSLEFCGNNAGVPCMIVSVDDVFVVPLPKTMKPTGLLRPDAISAVSAELREETVRRIRNAQGGWSALAAGAAGRPGIAIRAADEDAAVKGAMADCARQDRDCKVIAIGPFIVQPN